jgi:DNA-binding SARP family transcriptional activator
MDEYATPNKPQGSFPLLRVWLCGPFQMEWIDSATDTVLLAADAMEGSRDRTAALSLLALLLCQPNRQAHRDWVMEQFWPEGSRSAAVHRLENIFSCLRKLLRPPSGGESLLYSMMGKKTSGPTYGLEAYPKLWVDTDALIWYVEQAARMERFGDDALPFWERAFGLLKRGPFLADASYDPYATWIGEQRSHLEGYARQCVHALSRLYLTRHGEAGKAEAQLLLRTYWQQHKADEDILRPLLELLGEQERYQEAEQYYRQLLMALAELGPDETGQPRIPDARTSDIREYLHTRQIQRESKMKDRSAILPLLPTTSLDDQRVTPPTLFIPSTISELSVRSDFTLPISLLPQSERIEVGISDCATKFGHLLAKVITCVQKWYGMAKFCHPLQDQLDQEIRGLDALKSQYSLETYALSRRSFLIALAALPTALLMSSKQEYKLVLNLEEFLPQCAASVTACWHLSGGNHLDTIVPIIDSYLPTLAAAMKYAPSYREVAANLVAQCYFLKAILAWHVEGLVSAETYCSQAMQYSIIAKNTNLQLTALNQHALILYYGKQFQKALAKSEEAEATFQHTSSEHIFPIVQGRVYMYLSALQAQQARGNAEQTLEFARKAFALQAAVAEPVPLYADCGEAPLFLWDGLTHYHLSFRTSEHAESALTSLRKFGQLQPSINIPERFRLECLTNRTLAAIQCNEMEEAVACLAAGKQGARALESRQRNAEVAYAYQTMLERWPKEERVQALGMPSESIQ